MVKNKDNLSIIKFNITIEGNEETKNAYNISLQDLCKKPFIFRPKMINPDIDYNNPYNDIYFTSKFFFSTSLIESANINNPEQKIFTSINDFQELMKYVKDNDYIKSNKKAKETDHGISIEKGLDDDSELTPMEPPSENNIIIENINFLREVYFSPKQNFYPFKEEYTTQRDKSKVYSIVKSKIKSPVLIYKNARGIPVYKVNITLFLVPGKTPSQKDLLGCSKLEIELDDLLSQILDRKINYFKPKPKKIKRIKPRITELKFTGDRGQQLPKQPRLSANKRAALMINIKKFKTIFEKLQKKYPGINGKTHIEKLQNFCLRKI